MIVMIIVTGRNRFGSVRFGSGLFEDSSVWFGSMWQSSGESYMWEDKLSECQIRGWNAVSAAGLHGEGLRKRI